MAPGFSFQKRERIKKKNDFKHVYAGGTFLKSPCYNCYCIGNTLSYSRIGIVTKKKIGNAVKRNYEKRVLREFFRHLKTQIQPACDIIFVVKNPSASFLEKQQSFLAIVERIRRSF